jgi:hypothetical protein
MTLNLIGILKYETTRKICTYHHISGSKLSRTLLAILGFLPMMTVDIADILSAGVENHRQYGDLRGLALRVRRKHIQAQRRALKLSYIVTGVLNSDDLQ